MAIVARNWRGILVFAMTKRVETNQTIIPLRAEAETINWATQRALKLDVYYIIMESDAKVCVEAIHGELPF